MQYLALKENAGANCIPNKGIPASQCSLATHAPYGGILGRFRYGN
jgi:hypothetical protein